MADFSKQYCELHDMGFDGDFDIMEEFDKLEPKMYVPYICEGFGFIAIGRNENNECMLCMPIDSDNIMWKKYTEIIK